MPSRLSLCALALLLCPLSALAESGSDACLIDSTDDLPAVRLCQQNINIPVSLFKEGFCQPQIPDREFRVQMVDACPEGAYGKCEGAKSAGVGYRQSIFYYSDEDDAPVLAAYCEQISDGRWVPLAGSEQR